MIQAEDKAHTPAYRQAGLTPLKGYVPSKGRVLFTDLILVY